MTDEKVRAGGDGLATLLKPVAVLVLICIVAGALLGFVHAATAPVAAEVAAQRARQTYTELMPDAAAFEPLACEVKGCTAALQAVGASGETLGHLVVAQAKGYSGAVPLAVAFDTSGTVTSIKVMKNDETPGLGTKIADTSFTGQFVGRAAEALKVEDIDTISGATISSKAALAAFNVAVEAYKEVA